MKKVVFVSLTCLILISFLLTGCFSTKKTNDSNKDTNNPTKETDDSTSTNDKRVSFVTKKDIKGEFYFSEDNHKFIMKFTNSGDKDLLALWLSITYKDKNGKVLWETSDSLKYLKKGSDCYFYDDMNFMYDSIPYDNIELPAKVEVSLDEGIIDQKFIENFTFYNDKINISYKHDNSYLYTTITNNSDKKIGLFMLAILYLKDNKPIDVDYVELDDFSGTQTEKLLLPRLRSPKNSDYDKIEFNVNYAVTNNASN